MTNPPTLQDYLPSSNQVPVSLIVSTRQSLVNYLSQWWPQVDTRAGSVFGDLVVTPDAVLNAAHTIAGQMMFSDLQLTNIANGIINNTGFVTAYLKNFGVSAQATSVSSSGSMAMTFSVNQTYIFSAATVFNFGAYAFQVNATVANPVIISPVGTTDAQFVLAATGNGQFSVYIPVVGPSGAIVTDGTAATTNLAQTQLISITAAGDFSSGSLPSTLPELAAQAIQLYPAASLTSRAGALSFIAQNWPGLLANSVTVTGDPEMIRASQNPLGINQSALDMFVRSETTYVSGNVVATLTFNPEMGGWIGGLPFPSPPAFFSATSGAFQFNLFDELVGKNIVYSQSLSPTIDSVGIAFSQYEQLGIFLTDQTPISNNGAILNQPAQLLSDGVSLLIEGQYAGSIFQELPNRNVTLRFNETTQLNGVTAVVATAVDSVNNISETVYFVPDGKSPPLTGIILQSDPGYESMFSGLNLIVAIAGETWNPASAVGAEWTFSFQGETANFSIDYVYEPLVPVVASTIKANDNVSVNTSVLVKSFVPCNITQFVVNYRAKQGTSVNTAAAQISIFNYINSISYPDAYEESQIGAIMMQAGASGVSSVTKTGLIYPSLASVYVNKSQTQIPIPPVITTTLAVPSTDLGFGIRNVIFILPMAAITFNATTY